MKSEITITVYTENQVGFAQSYCHSFFREGKSTLKASIPHPVSWKAFIDFYNCGFEDEEIVRKLAPDRKQVDVLKVYFNTNDEIIWQEMALYKVPADIIAEKVKVERLLRENRARAVVIRKDYIVFETTGQRRNRQPLIARLQPLGLIEFVRSSQGSHNQSKCRLP